MEEQLLLQEQTGSTSFWSEYSFLEIMYDTRWVHNLSSQCRNNDTTTTSDVCVLIRIWLNIDHWFRRKRFEVRRLLSWHDQLARSHRSAGRLYLSLNPAFSIKSAQSKVILQIHLMSAYCFVRARLQKWKKKWYPKIPLSVWTPPLHITTCDPLTYQRT